MILQRLTEYAERVLKLPPEMYSLTPVRWIVDLSADGTLLGFVGVGGDTPGNARGNAMLMPHISRSSGVRAKLLTDNAEYALGVDRSGTPAGVKVRERHAAFRALVQTCAEQVEDPHVQAVHAFLTAWTGTSEHLPDPFNPADTVTFRVAGTLPTDLPAVQAFWARQSSVKPTTGNARTTDAAPDMTCLVTNVHGPVVDRLPLKVKRVPGGQPSGTVLVSANTPPTYAYGNKAGYVAPISRGAAEKFGQALNHLLNDPSSSFRVGPLVYVFWTRDPAPFSIASLFDRPDPQDVQGLLASPARGTPTYGASQNAYHALALSAGGGRAIVRSWSEGNLSDLQDRLRRYFDAQRIVDPYGAAVRAQTQLPVSFSAYALASSTYRDASKDMQSDAPASIIGHALHGTRLPHDLLARVVQRVETGTKRPDGSRERITHAQAALLKLILTSHGVPMADMQHLNPTPPLDARARAAYLCGRLLAELEDLQRTALGPVNTTVTDRYYRAACNTPAQVFGPLLESSVAHLAKLRRKHPATHDAIQARLEEILSGLRDDTGTPTYPKHLNTEQNGIFSIGYYHQRAHARAARIAARALKEQKETNA